MDDDDVFDRPDKPMQQHRPLRAVQLGDDGDDSASGKVDCVRRQTGWDVAWTASKYILIFAYCLRCIAWMIHVFLHWNTLLDERKGRYNSAVKFVAKECQDGDIDVGLMLSMSAHCRTDMNIVAEGIWWPTLLRAIEVETNELVWSTWLPDWLKLPVLVMCLFAFCYVVYRLSPSSAVKFVADSISKRRARDARRVVEAASAWAGLNQPRDTRA